MMIGIVMSCGIVAAIVPNVAFADDCPDGTIETNIFGCVEDNDKGGAMFKILEIVLTVLTYGVGIGGVLGIVISGIQYLTARDNEAQAAKARRRILEVVIGLIVYAVMYIVLNFLLIPGGI